LSPTEFMQVGVKALLTDLDDDGDRLMRSRARLRARRGDCHEHRANAGHKAGASAILEHSWLERAVRDVQAAVKHVAMSAYS
jgi:hypothetical protein